MPTRIACVGSVRFVALGTVTAGVMVAALASSPPDAPDDSRFDCVMREGRLRSQAAKPIVADEIATHGACSCGDAGRTATTVLEKRTLELACRLYSDEFCRHPFSVFETPTHAGKTAVIVKRSTGDCGGCGALTVAAAFDHGTLEAIGELGKLGRFGHGPDGARWVPVAGELALELAWSESNHGYTHDYRTVFTRTGDGFQAGLCIETGFDDRGAREKPSEWTAQLAYRNTGAIDIHYTTVQRGESLLPDLTPVVVPYDRAKRRWSYDSAEDGCVSPPDPRANDVLLYAPAPN